MSGIKSDALTAARLIIEILRVIPRRRFITAQEVAAHLDAVGMGRGIRTVQRLLDEISVHYPIERDTRGKPYGYRWMPQAEGLRLPNLTPDEALLLRLAYEDLRDLLPTALLRRLAPLFESARLELASPSAAAERRWLGKVVRVSDGVPVMPPPLEPEVVVAVSEALYLERKLAIRYLNARRKERNAVVWPLGLAQQGTRLYLVARFEGFDNERILALPRILQATVLGEPFVYPADFTLARYVAEGHFGIRQGGMVRLTFAIAKPTGQFLVESPLGRDQQVVEHDDHLVITATLPDSQRLDRWLRGFGSEVWGIEKVPVDDSVAPG